MGERMDELKGRVKQGVGKVTGDEQTRAEGHAEAESAEKRRKAKGKVQEVGGRVQEGVGDVLDNKRMEAEGRANRLKGETRQAG